MARHQEIRLVARFDDEADFVSSMGGIQLALGAVDWFGGTEPLTRIEDGSGEQILEIWRGWPGFAAFRKTGSRGYRGAVGTEGGYINLSITSRLRNTRSQPDTHWDAFRLLCASHRCEFGCSTVLSDSDIQRGEASRSSFRSSYATGGFDFSVGPAHLGRGIPDVYHYMAFGEAYSGLVSFEKLREASLAFEDQGKVSIFKFFNSGDGDVAWETKRHEVVQAIGPRLFWKKEGAIAPPEFLRFVPYASALE